MSGEEQNKENQSLIRCDVTGREELDLGTLPIDKEEKSRLINIVREVFAGEQIKPEELEGVQIEGVGGIMAKMKEKLTGGVVVASTDRRPRGFCAWDGIASSVSCSLWNDTNFSNAILDTVLLISRARERENMKKWLAVDGFTDGIRVVLNDMYELRRKLFKGEAYQGCVQYEGLQEQFCKDRGLPLANAQIEVLEFLLKAAEGGPLDYIPSASSLLPKELLSAPAEQEDDLFGPGAEVKAGNMVVTDEALATKLKATVAQLDVLERKELPPDFFRLKSNGGQTTLHTIRSLDDLPELEDSNVERVFREMMESLVNAILHSGRVEIEEAIYGFLEETAKAKGTKFFIILAFLSDKPLVREDYSIRLATEEEVFDFMSCGGIPNEETPGNSSLS